MAKIKMNAANLGAVINKNIYGHFSEHLGRCSKCTSVVLLPR